MNDWQGGPSGSISRRVRRRGIVEKFFFFSFSFLFFFFFIKKATQMSKNKEKGRGPVQAFSIFHFQCSETKRDQGTNEKKFV